MGRISRGEPSDKHAPVRRAASWKTSEPYFVDRSASAVRLAAVRWTAGEKKGIPLLVLLFATLMFTLLNTGCSALGSGAGAAASIEPGTVLFSDDFANPPSGWGIWNRGGASVDYHNGGLRILIDETQYDFWSVAGQRFSDAIIEVDATKQAGPDDNDFGIICRYQDKDNFYMLVVSSDGYYGIAKMKSGQYSMIGSDQLQYSDLIAQGQATNHLRADCIGRTLRLSVNGETLMEARDADFTSGDVGVLAGAYDVQGVDILFDNFVVKKP